MLHINFSCSRVSTRITGAHEMRARVIIVCASGTVRTPQTQKDMKYAGNVFIYKSV